MMKKTLLTQTIVICTLLHSTKLFAQTGDSLLHVYLPEVTAQSSAVRGYHRQLDSLTLTTHSFADTLLQQSQERSVLPVLNQYVPGLFFTSRSILGYGVSTGGSGAIKMRGIGGTPNTDILVVVNGVPQYAGLYGHPIADSYLTHSVEKVEVVNTPTSVEFGSNAMGGVIYLTTSRPKQDTVLTHLHLHGGSFYTLDAGVSNQFHKDKFTSSVDASYARTDGHRANMEFEEANGNAAFDYDINTHWQLHAAGNITYFKTHNPGTEDKPIYGGHQQIIRGSASLSTTYNYSKTFPLRGLINAYYNGGKHRINEGSATPDTPNPTLYNHTDYFTGINFNQQTDFFRGNTTTFGFDGYIYGGHAWNDISQATGQKTQQLVRKTQYEGAVYVDFAQRITRWLSVDAACRLDYHSQSGWAYAPRAVVGFHWKHESSLKTIVTKGFRHPTIRELYMYPPANDQLKPVSLWSYSLDYGTYLYQRRLHLQASVYYLHADNMIETQMVDGKNRNVNTGEVQNAGAEGSVTLQLPIGLMLNANYAYLYMHRPQLAAPEHKLTVTLAYHHSRFRVGTSVQYVNNLFTRLKTAQVSADKQSFVLWNANASVRIWRELWADVKADNLLAQRYEINYGFPMPRTTIIGGLHWTF